MKKIIVLLMSIVLIQANTMAGNDKPIAVNKLPERAQTFIKQHFNDVKVSFAKVDKDLFDTSYEVIFTNGSKVEFDKKGNWKEVDCKHSQVPDAIIPAQILQYIKENHSELKIISIDRDRRDYEVKLSNKLEVKFDLKFNVIGYDD